VCDTLCTSVEHVRVHNGRTMHRLSFARNTDQKLSFLTYPYGIPNSVKIAMPFQEQVTVQPVPEMVENRPHGTTRCNGRGNNCKKYWKSHVQYTSDESECITNCINSSSPSHEVDC
jgi:hypothetical protein